MNARGHSIRARRRAVMALGGVLLAGSAAAQAPLQPTEASVKAAYLYRFLAHVEWPSAAFASPEAPLAIGVAGADEVVEELQHVVAGRQVNGRPVQARRLADNESVAGLHVVFIGSAARQPARLVERLRGRPVLIVMDGPSGLEAGAMLSLVPVGGRIRFEASPMSAEREGLKLGARLLALAERVVTR